MRTVNLFFVEVIHLGFENQKRLTLAINDPSSSRYVYLLGTYSILFKRYKEGEGGGGGSRKREVIFLGDHSFLL